MSLIYDYCKQLDIELPEEFKLVDYKTLFNTNRAKAYRMMEYAMDVIGGDGRIAMSVPPKQRVAGDVLLVKNKFDNSLFFAIYTGNGQCITAICERGIAPINLNNADLFECIKACRAV